MTEQSLVRLLLCLLVLWTAGSSACRAGGPGGAGVTRRMGDRGNGGVRFASPALQRGMSMRPLTSLVFLSAGGAVSGGAGAETFTNPFGYWGAMGTIDKPDRHFTGSPPLAQSAAALD